MDLIIYVAFLHSCLSPHHCFSAKANMRESQRDRGDIWRIMHLFPQLTVSTHAESPKHTVNQQPFSYRELFMIAYDVLLSASISISVWWGREPLPAGMYRKTAGDGMYRHTTGSQRFVLTPKWDVQFHWVLETPMQLHDFSMQHGVGICAIMHFLFI